MSLQTRLGKVEQRAREIDQSSGGLVPLTIPWPDEDGGPIRWLVPPEFIDNLNRAYGHRSEQPKPTG